MVTGWAWWGLPIVMRLYVAAVPVAAAAAMGFAIWQAEWRLLDLAKFLLLGCCAVVSVASTPRIAYRAPGATRDFMTVWVLPVAILLPPAYAAVVPIPMFAALWLWVYRGVLHRTVFTAASISLTYFVASLVFRSFPASFAGGTVGSGLHAFTWAVAVTACEILGGRIQALLVGIAVKLANPGASIRKMQWSRDALQGLFVALDLSVLITMAVALTPALVLIALPTVLLARRYLVHPVLVAQSRVDAKTGLLNVSTWELEASVELSRSIRGGGAAALAVVDIDHFKRVNDTHGHLVGDRVLKAVANALRTGSRDYDRTGRFGGEEFVLLLANADQNEACRIAERLRDHIGKMQVPVDDRPDGPTVSVTISVGVAAMKGGTTRELTELLTAADSALYDAKQAGRNRVCLADVGQREQFVAEFAGQMESVRADSAGASLCPAR
jgi:diguanylate cyclase (GGDEF)-like protein